MASGGDYAKAAPRDLCLRIRVRNAGPAAAPLHVLPHLWFRNRWSWGDPGQRPELQAAPDAPAGRARVPAQESSLGRWRLIAGPDPSGRPPTLLFCENETNTQRLFGDPGSTPYPKDGINDHVVDGAPTVNPALHGTKMACWYRLQVPPGETLELRLRLAHDDGDAAPDLGAGFEQTLAERAAEADAYYATLTPAGVSAGEAAVMRQAFAGTIWSQQFYHYDVERWLAGDPGRPAPPARRQSGRNAGWRHLDNHDILVMPDTWEYPWYAAWDLGFHCVVLAHTDPAAAKHQLLLLLREWYMHPNGQLPAYEWSFGDVNPPVQAWAALAVFRIDGGQDLDFLARALHACLGTAFTVELPTGSGIQATLGAVADEIERRLLRLFLRDASGRRPLDGDHMRFQQDSAWGDPVLFYEYFHGDTGAGLGASHRTGWTALVGALVANRRGGRRAP